MLVILKGYNYALINDTYNKNLFFHPETLVEPLFFFSHFKFT